MDEVSAQAARNLLERHVELTGSARGADVLSRWDVVVGQFHRVVPKAARELRALAEAEVESAAD